MTLKGAEAEEGSAGTNTPPCRGACPAHSDTRPSYANAEDLHAEEPARPAARVRMAQWTPSEVDLASETSSICSTEKPCLISIHKSKYRNLGLSRS